MGREGTLDVDPMSAETRRAVEETIAKIDRSWSVLLEALEGIPRDKMAEPGVSGEWSIKDLIGHIAFWDAQAVESIHRRVAGEPTGQRDWQVMNDRSAAAIRNRPLEDLQSELIQTHQQMLDVLRMLPPTDSMTADVCALIPDDTYQHYDEHATDIRAWRERADL